MLALAVVSLAAAQFVAPDAPAPRADAALLDAVAALVAVEGEVVVDDGPATGAACAAWSTTLFGPRAAATLAADVCVETDPLDVTTTLAPNAIGGVGLAAPGLALRLEVVDRVLDGPVDVTDGEAYALLVVDF